MTIYVDGGVDSKSEKLEALKFAASDSQFLADIQEIRQDFDLIV